MASECIRAKTQFRFIRCRRPTNSAILADSCSGHAWEANPSTLGAAADERHQHQNWNNIYHHRLTWGSPCQPTMDLFTVADIWKNVSHRSKQIRSCDTSKALRPCFYTVILKAAVANLILYTHKLKELMIYVTILHWIVLSKLLSLHFAFEQQYKIYLRKQSSTYKSM